MTNIDIRDDVTVQFVDSMGGEKRIVEAARVSTEGMEAMESEESSGLISYLFNNRHASPFEHLYFTFIIQAPIFVTREMLRHRISNFNEESGRYRQLRPVFYIPNRDRKIVQVGKVGAYDFVAGSDEQYKVMESAHNRVYNVAYEEYIRQLDAGIAREVARNVLPVGLYSSLMYTANLRSLSNFLSLRVDWGNDAVHPSSPTYEIELVALEIGKKVREDLPTFWELFEKNGYRPV